MQLAQVKPLKCKTLLQHTKTTAAPLGFQHNERRGAIL